MSLPKQVQQHLKDLEAYEQQLAQPQPEQPSDENGSPPDNVVTLEQADPQEAATSPEGSGDQGDSAPEPSQASEQDDTVPEEKWEHKYRRLQGKYDAEVPRLHSEIKELRALIEQLQAPKPEEKPEEKPARVEPLVTEQDVDAFGDDLIDLQRRVTREVLASEFNKELDKIRKENEVLKSQLTQVQGNTFETRLRQAVPDFDQINQDQRWVEWLNEVDPMLRAPRRTAAQAAWNNGDVEAVKAYVDLFKQSIGADQEKSPQTQRKRQAELKRQVQPSKATSTATSAQAGQQKTYSAQEADGIFRQVQRLITEGRHEEAAALENEISAAYVEGRVRG